MAKAVKVAKVAKVRKVKKNKYLVLYSPFLMKETKHELIGEPIEKEDGQYQWARCTRSHHLQFINLKNLQASKLEDIRDSMTREDSIKYDPYREYNINDVIYHEAWDDIGYISSKEITSSGGYAIVIQFEKNKQKRLIEKLAN